MLEKAKAANERRYFDEDYGKPSVAPLSDASSIPKLLSAVSSSSMLSASPGFVRPSRGVTSARFGSALNIETLVAAAALLPNPITKSHLLTRQGRKANQNGRKTSPMRSHAYPTGQNTFMRKTFHFDASDTMGGARGYENSCSPRLWREYSSFKHGTVQQWL